MTTSRKLRDGAAKGPVMNFWPLLGRCPHAPHRRLYRYRYCSGFAYCYCCDSDYHVPTWWPHFLFNQDW